MEWGQSTLLTSSNLVVVRGGGVVAARTALGWIGWCTSRCRFSRLHTGLKGGFVPPRGSREGHTHSREIQIERDARALSRGPLNKKPRMVVWYPPKCCNAVLSRRYFETLPPVTQN